MTKRTDWTGFSGMRCPHSVSQFPLLLFLLLLLLLLRRRRR
jgi:MYXO-CTERM domain-containing protein